jgi:glycosyltransferase involved in cell wall biosynthesis
VTRIAETAREATPARATRTRTVVFTVPWGERLGGAENMLWTFLRHVDRAAVEPIVVFLEDGPFARELAASGIRTVVLPAGRLRQLRRALATVRSLAALLRRARPDLVVNWTSKTHLYGAPAAVLAGVGDRVVWWQHGIPRGHWMDRAATVLPALAVGCSSQACASRQEEVRPRRRTFVVHPGIAPSHPLRDEERLQLRRHLGIRDDAAVVGIVGRLQPWKGQHRVLRAVARLRRRGFRVHALVVGGDAHGRSPEYEPYLRSLADELDLVGAVAFTGHVPDPVPYLSAMDVMVNASDDEPFGLVLVEAMALGIAVVAVDSGGPSEIVERGESGVLVETSDENALVEALEMLLDDPRRRRRLAERATERFHSRFTATRMTEQLTRELDRLCVERTGSSVRGTR